MKMAFGLQNILMLENEDKDATRVNLSSDLLFQALDLFFYSDWALLSPQRTEESSVWDYPRCLLIEKQCCRQGDGGFDGQQLLFFWEGEWKSL